MAWNRIDKGTGQVGGVTEEEVKEKVRGYYWDIPATIRTAKEGAPIQTSFAYYEYKEEE